MILFTADRARNLVAPLDPRLRVLLCVGYAFLVVCLRRWVSLGLALSVALVLVGVARAYNRTTLRRLAALNLFTLFLAVFLPLSTPGRILFRAGALAWTREGFASALRIGAKANAVMLASGAFLATMDPSTLGHALGRLGLPHKLTHILLFCIRYLEVFHDEYHRLRNAMKLRAFRPTCRPHALRSFGHLVGMLFLHSFDRADRIVEAMKCRAFRGTFYALSDFRFGRGDAVFAAVFLATALIVGAAEWVV
jgi:cobalt/nickel transport system permease protein